MLNGLLTQSYAFSATNSAGTPVQIVSPAIAGYSVNSYLVTNLSAQEAYVILANTSANAAQILPASNGGNSVPIAANSARIIAGPPSAYFNAQTASSSASLSIIGCLSSN